MSAGARRRARASCCHYHDTSGPAAARAGGRGGRCRCQPLRVRVSGAGPGAAILGPAGGRPWGNHDATENFGAESARMRPVSDGQGKGGMRRGGLAGGGRTSLRQPRQRPPRGPQGKGEAPPLYLVPGGLAKDPGVTGATCHSTGMQATQWQPTQSPLHGADGSRCPGTMSLEVRSWYVPIYVPSKPGGTSSSTGLSCT